jgi:methionyl-tRNA formyltransferase
VIVDDVNAASFVSSIEAADVGLVCGFNQIFGPEAIARFAQLVNVHPSVLPLYRGPVPSRWCLANGEAQSGFTLHRVTARIDAGEILHQEAVYLQGCTTVEEADRRISQAAAARIAVLLDRVVLGRGDFTLTRLDAKSIYRVHRDYAGFVA